MLLVSVQEFAGGFAGVIRFAPASGYPPQFVCTSKDRSRVLAELERVLTLVDEKQPIGDVRSDLDQ